MQQMIKPRASIYSRKEELRSCFVVLGCSVVIEYQPCVSPASDSMSGGVENDALKSFTFADKQGSMAF